MVSRICGINARISYGLYNVLKSKWMERNRVDKETMQMLQEMIKIQEEKRIFEEAARQEDEKRIAIEKEAAELEAKCKSPRGCLNFEEKLFLKLSIRSKKSRIDPTLRNIPLLPTLSHNGGRASQHIFQYRNLLTLQASVDDIVLPRFLKIMKNPARFQSQSSQYFDL
ncbi:hypothetical protein Tco_1255474 [Tanacetum coccineum]